MSLQISILVREDGNADVSASGARIPSSGYLGPVVMKVCAVLLPPGEYALEIDATGKIALASRVTDATRSDEGGRKLREVEIELLNETNLSAFAAG